MNRDERQPVIVEAVRTPIGKFQGGLSSFSAPELGSIAIRELLTRSKVKADVIDGVIMGQVITAGVGQAPARQAAIWGGVPTSVPAQTVNEVCGSGLRAVMLAAQAIRAGDADCMVAGGQESMTNTPYAIPKARGGLRLGDGSIVDLMLLDGLYCPFEKQAMGCAADYTAAKAEISREAQDRFALASQGKAVKAMAAGAFRREIVPVLIKGKKGDQTIAEDEAPRADVTAEQLARLKPAFTAAGTVTAGNSSTINDGASVLLVTSWSFAKKQGLTPRAAIVDYCGAAMDPKEIFFTPIRGIERLLKRLKVTIEDFDLLEVNEAFAAQILADGLALRWDWDRLNVRGGAIALGHPIGASGARILTTLIHTLEDQKKTRGLAALCLGGGGAVAMAIERI